MFTESLPSNERVFWLRHSVFRASCHNIEIQLILGRDFRSHWQKQVVRGIKRSVKGSKEEQRSLIKNKGLQGGK
jgi:hypothetical protein